METISNCPICNSSGFKPFLDCKDYTVSRETFTIVQCSSCGFKFINPRPEEEIIGNYYKSEDYISHTNTSKGFINYTYQTVRKYTLLKKLQLISRYKRTGKILDIGCGTGEFLNVCKHSKWETTGIEPSQETRKSAIERFGLDVKEEKEITNFGNESFDIITMWHVLEHVPSLNQRLQDLKRLIKPNGIIIIAVPNCNSYDASVYKEKWAAYDVPRHLYNFTPKDIDALFKKHSLKVIKVLPMVFDSFYVSLLSEKAIAGKVNFLKAMWIGLVSNIVAIKTGSRYSSQIYVIEKIAG